MSNNHGDIVIAAPAGYKWDEGTLKKITYVAEAGGVKYESLQKAIDAAKSKAVVTMLADTRENVTISKAHHARPERLHPQRQHWRTQGCSEG